MRELKNIAAGLAVISMAGSGAGVGMVFGSFLTALSRNPQTEGSLFRYCILGFAITEAVRLVRLNEWVSYYFFFKKNIMPIPPILLTLFDYFCVFEFFLLVNLFFFFILPLFPGVVDIY